MTDAPLNSSVAVGSLYSWNGPVCPTCRRGYLGQHQCSIEDLTRLRDDLNRRIDDLTRAGSPQLRACPSCTIPNGTARICMNVACPFATKVTC